MTPCNDNQSIHQLAISNFSEHSSSIGISLEPSKQMVLNQSNFQQQASCIVIG